MFHINLLVQATTGMTKGDASDQYYEEGFDDISSILADICDKLQDLDVVRYSVGGFGQAEWPVDVRYDLLTFMGQIGDVLESIDKREQTDLSFPEQGIQRIVHIAPLNGSSQLRCTSFGNWTPSDELVELDTSQLREILSRVVKVFLAVSTTYCPSLSNHPWFVEWEKALNGLLSV